MLAPAFPDPPRATQAVFRRLMEAMARPGEVRSLALELTAPAPLGGAAAALALTLLDYETPFWLDPPLAAAPELREWFKFHTGAPLTADCAEAVFAFVADPARCPPFAAFAQGSLEYPDRSTTLVLQVDGFDRGEPFELAGPGIAGTRRLRAAPLPDDFRARLAANRALFPRGIDLVLASRDAVAALPRSIRVRSGDG
jgi:alpha-D-ribose 1-methylphosphonate 5-triphosphate synthase subunit PhnH